MQANVVVHKAKIQMLRGETVSDFTRALNEAGKEHVRLKLNLTKKDSYVWAREIYAGSVIFMAEKYSRNSDGFYKYFATDYKRDKNGVFTFGSLVEVKRLTVFKPTKPTIVIKSIDTVKKSTKKTFGDWQETEKSFWSGII